MWDQWPVVCLLVVVWLNYIVVHISRHRQFSIDQSDFVVFYKIKIHLFDIWCCQKISYRKVLNNGRIYNFLNIKGFSSHYMSPSWIYLFRLEQEFVQTQSCTAAALLLSPVCCVCRILLLRDAIFIFIIWKCYSVHLYCIWIILEVLWILIYKLGGMKQYHLQHLFV